MTKANYQGQTRIVEVDIAETKPLFFKLDPIPARLEIETVPSRRHAVRERQPGPQPVPAGRSRPGRSRSSPRRPTTRRSTIDLSLAPGQLKRFVGADRLRLSYRQRSGRPELLVASGDHGHVWSAPARSPRRSARTSRTRTSRRCLLVGGGGVAGGVAGALVATPLVPKYIPDNRALFIIGGDVDRRRRGVGAGLVVQQLIDERQRTPCPPARDRARAAARSASHCAPGSSAASPASRSGSTTGALFAKRAPTYGRVALIQSAALGGALAGGLLQIATQWQPYGAGWEYSVRKRGKDMSSPFCTGPAETDYCAYPEHSALDLAPGALIGLNVGLAAGLLGAYLPDQSRYGIERQARVAHRPRGGRGRDRRRRRGLRRERRRLPERQQPRRRCAREGGVGGAGRRRVRPAGGGAPHARDSTTTSRRPRPPRRRLRRSRPSSPSVTWRERSPPAWARSGCFEPRMIYH